MIEPEKTNQEPVAVGSDSNDGLGALSDEDFSEAFLADFRSLVEKYCAVFSVDDYCCFASLCRNQGTPHHRWVGIDFSEADLEAKVHRSA